MLKQDVPLRTGWFGYRKLDVENCIAHIRAAYAAELRLARQTQQGMEETMAQLRQENKALRQRFAQQAAAQAAASVRAEGSDKLQQLTRKLEAAHAEIRRYQTRLFACERQMIALRRENADLEAACEQGGAADGRGPCRKGRAAGCPDACLSGSAGAGPDAGTARRSCGLLCKTGRTACGAAGTRVAAGNGAGEAFGGAAAPV